MNRRGPLFVSAGLVALGIGLGPADSEAQDAQQLQALLENRLQCENYFGTGDIGTLAAIAADSTDPRQPLAESCLALLVAPAQGFLGPDDDRDNDHEPIFDGVYPG